MLIKTSDLIGSALDWAVVTAQGVTLERSDYGGYYTYNENRRPKHSYLHEAEADEWESDCICPSTDWSQGGPIIEREQIAVDCIHAASDDVRWQAWTPAPEQKDGEAYGIGSTPLIAAMRCYVASKLGDTVDVPDELIG